MPLDLLSQAITDHQAGRLTLAEKGYRRLLAIQPNHPDANHNLGILAIQLGQCAAGLPYLKAALEHQPGQLQFWLSYLDALLRLNQLDAAHALLAQGQSIGLEVHAIEALHVRLSSSTVTLPSHADVQALVNLFNTRKFSEAEQLAREMTKKYPSDGFSWKVLGAALQELGKVHESLAPKQRAVELLPDDVEALSNLGHTYCELNAWAEASVCLRQALVIDPDHAVVCNNLGLVLWRQGVYLEEAEQHLRHAISIRPDYAEAHDNLGSVLRKLARMDEAEVSYRRAIMLRPNSFKVYSNLAALQMQQGLLVEAEASLVQALKLQPDFAEAYNNLGTVYREQGRFFEAKTALRSAIALKNDFVPAYSNLGMVLYSLRDLPAAEASLRQALALQPDSIEVYNNLGMVLKEQGRWREAENQLRQALARSPDYPKAQVNLANTLKAQGLLAQAIKSYRQALNVQPDDCDAYSNLLLATMYASDTPPVASFSEHQHYGQRIAACVAALYRTHIPPSAPLNRPLRIGWVSADLRRHAVTYFLEPLLQQLRVQGFSLFAYANSHQQDEMTTRIRQHLEGWREVAGMSDAELVAQIVADQIDILIDLSGHTAGNRLPVFACKPAPVQVTWLGYPATTGVPGMDWRITDVHAEPEGLTEHLNTEKLWRLPEIFCCYQPSPNSPEPLPGLPCETLSPAERVQGLPPELAQAIDPSAQVMTLGCFNNFAKVTPPVIALWSHILSRLPQARLLLEIHGGQDPQFTADVRQRFVQAGARPEQIHIVPRKPEHQYALYRQLDLALDPFPCTGGTTSCDSLWMGVPFVTLAGEWFVGRMGVTLLHNAGLDELIAHSPAEYADKVVALVNDLPRLRAIRHGLRERVARSPIMDSARFGQHFAQALRGMWAASCEQVSSAPPR